MTHAFLALMLAAGSAAEGPAQAPEVLTPPARGGRPGGPTHPAPVVVAARASGPVRVDGRLDDEAWAVAQPVSGFRQLDPREGQPASESTEVRVLLGERALYVGARLYDREPSLIVARLARRDDPVPADLFEVLLDPAHDHRTAYAFGVTAAGARRDAIVSFDGDIDLSWDGVWDAAVARDSLGWTVELQVPLSQLRYDRAGDGAWGVQFRRVIHRRQETALFAFVPKREQAGVGRFGHLEGLQGLQVARSVQLVPHALARHDRLAGAGPATGLSAGVDATLRLGTGLALGATANPDFGQVDLDPAQVNLTAFELFFAERRPFFVEGTDVFRFGRIGASVATNATTFFHSRRIGRAPQRSLAGLGTGAESPDETSIALAAKLTGRVGPWAVGVLEALTPRELGSVGDTLGGRRDAVVEPLSNYTVARVRRDFRGGATAIGALLTSVVRRLPDSALAGLLRSRAHVGGVDVHHTWDRRRWQLDASLSGSVIAGAAPAIARVQRSSAHYYQRPDARHLRFDSTRTSLRGLHAQLSLARTAGSHWLGSLALQTATPGFEANDLGFHRRADYRSAASMLGYKVDQPRRVVRRWQTFATSRNVWTNDGVLGFAMWTVGASAQLANYWSVELEGLYFPRFSDDRLSRGGPLILWPRAGGIVAALESDPRRAITARATVNVQVDSSGYYEGIYAVAVSARPASAVELRVEPQVQRLRHPIEYVTVVDDPTAGATYGRRYVFADLTQTTWSAQVRLSWTFSPVLSLQVFAQPLLAAARYRSFSELRSPGRFTFTVYGRDAGTITRDSTGVVTADPDGGGPAAGFSFPDPTFDERSLRMNAVLRWEYRRGSTLFLVWQQHRSDVGTRGAVRFGRDASALLDAPGDNVFVVKVTYWLGR